MKMQRFAQPDYERPPFQWSSVPRNSIVADGSRAAAVLIMARVWDLKMADAFRSRFNPSATA